ncbi:hypothetical protein MACH17_27170 [Phaeobacter inhibens]|nr:hypothetical protein MACH17_27170 [Phaeobacter inhibens]
MALSNSEGAGSVRTLVLLSGAHLYIQVLGNQNRTVDWWSRRIPPLFELTKEKPHLMGTAD